ncbi:hypothetical protein V6Z12_A11G142600 [Gossypium hirsutum]
MYEFWPIFMAITTEKTPSKKNNEEKEEERWILSKGTPASPKFVLTSLSSVMSLTGSA